MNKNNLAGVMIKLYLLVYLFIFQIFCVSAQEDEFLNKFRSSKDTFSSNLSAYINLFFSYLNYGVIIYVIWQGVAIFRKSREHSDEDGGGFDWIKWIGPLGVRILIYVSVQVLARFFIT